MCGIAISGFSIGIEFLGVKRTFAFNNNQLIDETLTHQFNYYSVHLIKPIRILNKQTIKYKKIMSVFVNPCKIDNTK